MAVQETNPRRAGPRPGDGLTCTIVIATLDRPDTLADTLRGWQAGSRLPEQVRIVDASASDSTLQLCRRDWAPLKVTHLRTRIRSAAQQRNLGAKGVSTDLVVFCDDDILPPPDSLEKLCRVFASDASKHVGGVAATIERNEPRAPGSALRLYYHLQAGYAHRDYGGHFFGAAINLLPREDGSTRLLRPSQWLNSTLVAYRTDLFARTQFPPFLGYSFQEDVNLSWRIRATHRLYFHRGIRYVHLSPPAEHKAPRQIARMSVIYRWHNASVLLGLAGLKRIWKFGLSLAFDSLSKLKSHRPGWLGELAASWLAYVQLTSGRCSPADMIAGDRRLGE